MFSSSACSLRRVPHGVFFPGDLVPTSKRRAAAAPCVHGRTARYIATQVTRATAGRQGSLGTTHC